MLANNNTNRVHFILFWWGTIWISVTKEATFKLTKLGLWKKLGCCSCRWLGWETRHINFDKLHLTLWTLTLLLMRYCHAIWHFSLLPYITLWLHRLKKWKESVHYWKCPNSACLTESEGETGQLYRMPEYGVPVVWMSSRFILGRFISVCVLLPAQCAIHENGCN